MNRVFPSLHEGSLEIMLTVPLTKKQKSDKQRDNIIKKYIYSIAMVEKCYREKSQTFLSIFRF